VELKLYQPDFSITANGSDITTAIAASFSELTITDVSGEQADTLVIKLDGSKISTLPTKNAALEVSLGFTGALYAQGTFYVSNLSDSGFPEVVTITATSTPMGGEEMETSIQSHRSASYNDITISELLDLVAARNDLTAIINTDLASITIEHLD
jgi:phage protein D